MKFPLLKAAPRKARSQTSVVLAGSGGWIRDMIRHFLAGTQIDYEAEAGNTWLNSSVGAVVSFKHRAASAATIHLQQKDQKNDKWVSATPGPLNTNAVSLLRRPNKYYSWNSLLFAILLGWDCKGNVYLIKKRSGSGRVLALELAEPGKVRPSALRDRSGQSLITHYLYDAPDGNQYEYDIEDIIHLRCGVDPEAPALGLSSLAAAVREIVTENGAANWTAVAVKNQGRPSFLISPKPMEGNVLKAIAEKMSSVKEYLQQFVGDKRGEGAFIPFPMDVHSPAWKPSDVELSALRMMSIDIICANLGVSAKVVDLPTKAETFNNKAEAIDFAGKQTIIPTLTDIAEQLSWQLLPDYGLDPANYRFEWDYSGVKWLIDDTAEEQKRHRENWVAGGLDRFRFMELIGEKPVPADKGVTYFDIQQRAMPTQPLKDTSTKKELALAMVKSAARRGSILKKPTTIVVNSSQALHDARIKKARKQLADLANKLGTGKLKDFQFVEFYSIEIKSLHADLYELGFKAGGGTISAADVALYAQQITDLEQTFIQGLAVDLTGDIYKDADGVFNADHGALTNRLDWYAQKGSGSANQGYVDASDADEEFDWDLNGAVEDHCQDCPYLAENSPYTQATLYAVPRDCSTPCGGKCKCRLVRRSDGLSGFNPAPI